MAIFLHIFNFFHSHNPAAEPAGKIIIFHIHDFCGKWEVNLLGAAPTLALLLPLSPLVSTNSSVVLTKPHQLTEILIVQFRLPYTIVRTKKLTLLKKFIHLQCNTLQ